MRSLTSKLNAVVLGFLLTQQMVVMVAVVMVAHKVLLAQQVLQILAVAVAVALLIMLGQLTEVLVALV